MKKHIAAIRRRRFERVVVLLDITVVAHPNGRFYAAHVFNSVRKILEQCDDHNKSSTMWGFKLFDPFLPPLSSGRNIRAFLGKDTLFHFDATSTNLERFSQVLYSLVSTNVEYRICKEGGRRAEYISRAFNEIVDDYVWDPTLATDSSSSDEDRKRRGPIASKQIGGDGIRRDANMVVLISSLPTTREDVTSFLDWKQSVNDSQASSAVLGQMQKTFAPVGKAFQSKNIQVCLIDVPKGSDSPWSGGRLQTLFDSSSPRSLIWKCLSGLFRVFIPVHLIPIDLFLISPSVLPCELVWNAMADLDITESGTGQEAIIRCQPSDETIFCEVRLQALRAAHIPSLSMGSSLQTVKLSPADENIVIVLESILPKGFPFGRFTSKSFLVTQKTRFCISSTGKDIDTSGDKLLQLLVHPKPFVQGRPIWQLLLITLACNQSVCEVSFRDRDQGGICSAIMEPLTADSAILTVVDREGLPAGSGRLSGACGATDEDETPSNQNSCTEGFPDLPRLSEPTITQSRKRRREAKRPSDITLMVGEEFYRGDGERKEMIQCVEYWERVQSLSLVDSSDIPDGVPVISRYLSGGKASKVLQAMSSFLTNMRRQSCPDLQSSGLRPCNPELPLKVSRDLVLGDMDSDSRQPRAPASLTDAFEESLQPVADDFGLHGGGEALSGVDSKIISAQGLGEGCMTEEEATHYIRSAPLRIREYVLSTEVDCQKFAGMLVTESLRSLRILKSKRPVDNKENCDPNGKPSTIKREIASQLEKLLLRSPKELIAKDKASTCGINTSAMTNETLKEYELQILFRLEMILLDKDQLLRKSSDKHKRSVRDIYALLDRIQIRREGGMFGGSSFPDYCSRLFVDRYREIIPLTIKAILKELDLDECFDIPAIGFSLEKFQDASIDHKSRTRKKEDKASKVDGACETLAAELQSEKRDENAHGAHVHVTKPSSEGKKSKKLSVSTESPLEVLEKDLKLRTKDSYHFASAGSNLRRIRRFKKVGAPKARTAKRTNSVKVPGDGTEYRIKSTPLKLWDTEETPMPVLHGADGGADGIADGNEKDGNGQDMVSSPLPQIPSGPACQINGECTVASTLVRSNTMRPVRLLESDDDDEDDDGNGISSTPFRAPASASLKEVPFSSSVRPRRPSVSLDGVRKRIELPCSPMVKSTPLRIPAFQLHPGLRDENVSGVHGITKCPGGSTGEPKGPENDRNWGAGADKEVRIGSKEPASPDVQRNPVDTSEVLDTKKRRMVFPGEACTPESERDCALVTEGNLRDVTGDSGDLPELQRYTETLVSLPLDMRSQKQPHTPEGEKDCQPGRNGILKNVTEKSASFPDMQRKPENFLSLLLGMDPPKEVHPPESVTNSGLGTQRNLWNVTKESGSLPDVQRSTQTFSTLLLGVDPHIKANILDRSKAFGSGAKRIVKERL